jgi:type I restriction enzyme S subunit
MSFDLPDLPDGWSFASLESCSQKGSITYGIVQPGTQTEDGVPIIRVNNFRDTRIDVSDVMKVTPEIAAKYERTRLKGGEVLLTVVGTVGQVAVAPSSVAGYNVARAVAVIHPLPHVSAEWIALCLRSPYSQYLLESRANTTVQTTINLKDLRALPIPLPPERERASITEMVGAIDDRITLLRETNTTLEAIAQALFKSWFVDFDPVHDKMQGLAPEGMDEATAALFPDSFEESELGPVPKGWSMMSFRDSINVIGGGTPKTSVPEYWGGDIPWFSVVDAPSTSDVFVVDTEKHITEAGLNGSSTKLLPTGTTIISARGTVGRLALTGCPMAMNQSCYGLRGKAGDQYFTYFSTTRLVEQLKQRAHGSVFDTITQETFAGVSLCYPATEVIQAFEQQVEPLLMRIRENLIQSQSLASIRDTLLPRLISGQLPLTTAVEQLNA